MNPQDVNTQPQVAEQSAQPATTTSFQSAQPVRTKSKKRGIFWIVAPAAFVLVGCILMFINQLTPFDTPLHTILNVIAFVLIGGGSLAFIPGLIYGIILLVKK